MQDTRLALCVKSRPPWVLTALLLAALAFGAAAPAGHAQQRGGASPPWATYQPKGWSAGSVARGTGYRRPGASLRVREVQRRLNQLGYRAGQVDGLFGPLTEAAVRRYQRHRALQPDGIVGPRTLQDLRSGTRRHATAEGQTSGRERQASGHKTTPAPDRDDSNVPVWELVLLTAALLALLLLARGIVHARDLARRAAERIRAAARPAGARIAGGHYRTAYVEGRSTDERIGDFRGFAYTIRPMAGSEEAAEEAASLLVYDPSKPRPVYARLSEIMAINGQPIRPAGSPRHARREAALDSTARSEQAAVQSDRQAQPATEIAGPAASVTPLSSRRRESLPSLRIVRRIEAPRPAKAGAGGPPRSGTARMSERNRGRFPSRFRWIGARVHLADAEGIDPMPEILTLPVELELFAESDSSRWETGLLETDEPLRVLVDDLEESVRAAVVPEWFPQLAQALAEGGVPIHTDELARLPFAVERSIELERAIAGMEAFSIRAS